MVTQNPSEAIASERHHDMIFRSILIACSIVWAVVVVALVVARINEWSAVPWAMWAVLVLTPAGLAIWAARRMPYLVVVDERGVHRSGPGGGDLPWSEITDLVELATKQRHLAIVNTRGLSGLKGESAAPQKAYGLHEGTLVMQSSEHARRAIEAHLGRPARPSDRH
jgi:hypothetical protein